MDIAFEHSALEIQQLASPDFSDRKITLSLARLDKLHPDVSGNKLFKLHYFLEKAKEESLDSVITFGGAYSNHLVATAFACNELGLLSVGIVRGEEGRNTSHTLARCKELGMQIQHVTREKYKKLTSGEEAMELAHQYNPSIIIPEGGYHALGAKGASLIMKKIGHKKWSHVCVPVGTATTVAGLLAGAKEEHIVAVPALKNITDIPARIKALTENIDLDRLHILDEYHFGGYAKATHQLVTFMNDFFDSYNVPLDFVYTAKMMFGILEKINQGFFPAGSDILCLHTGGLQGNKSMLPYNLTFQ